MRTLKSALMLSVLVANLSLGLPGSASAFPLSASEGARLTMQPDVLFPTIEIRNRGGAVAAAIIGGMILGGIIASQSQPYYDQAYPPYPYHPAYRPYPMANDAVAYCMQRFKSYDPYSMTYLGYDGFRHSCP